MNGIAFLRLMLAVLILVGGLTPQVYAADIPLFIGEYQNNEVRSGPLLDQPLEFLPALRSRAMHLTPLIATVDGLEEGDNLILDLFADRSYNARVDQVTINVNGTVTVRGRIEGHSFGYILISTTEGFSLGSIRIPERGERYVVWSDPATGMHFLLEMNVDELDELEDGPSLIPPASMAIEIAEMERVKTTSSILGGPMDPATVGIMVVYTPVARQWAQSLGGGIANVIGQAMGKASLALDNSNTLLSMPLVHSAEVNYVESGNSGADLRRLTASPTYNPWGDSWEGYYIPGYMDEVHVWRNQYGADLVALFAHVEDTGGLGWTLNAVAGRPNYGFSLTRVQQAGWTYTLIHELGHNMGCDHHKDQNVQPGPGLFDYSAGWRWTGNDSGNYCSVMTYASGAYFLDGVDHTRVAHFSNPDVLHQGVATGHSVDGDNARTIREIKHVIAAYRQMVHVMTPEFSPDGGEYTADVSVVVSCGTPNATIRYTLNGMDPTETDPVIVSGGSILVGVDPPTTLKARAWKDGFLPSEIKSATYAVKPLSVSIREAKQVEDDTSVQINEAIISAAWDNCFYISADDRSSGIRVEMVGHGLGEGMRATIVGLVQTTLDGERYIAASTFVSSGSGTVAPLGMMNNSVGGGDFIDSQTGFGQVGITGGAGLNNIGLLIKTWGRVTHVGTTYFYIDDGSDLDDGSGYTGIKVESGRHVNPMLDEYVTVIGISSCFKENLSIHRLVREKAHAYSGEMVYIPGGSFLMGNNGNEPYSRSDELPQHSVYLSGYYIGKYEVTRGEYRQFMNAGGYSNPGYWTTEGWDKVGGYRTEPAHWAEVQDWWTGNFTQTDDHPVVGVSYYEAEAFCKWAGGRLPTEAEWEKAARWTGSHSRVYPWGDIWDPEKCNNWNDTNPAGGGYRKKQTAPVGSYPAGVSPYGLHDMAGNVMEWCTDWYQWDYYSQTPPGGWVDPEGPASGSYRVLRGGYWYSDDLECRSAYRYCERPSYLHYGIGFRVAR